jgi:hypothetical protein
MSKFSWLIADKVYKACMLGGAGGGLIGSAIGAYAFLDVNQNPDYKNSNKTLLDKFVFGTLGATAGLICGFSMGFMGTFTAPISIPVILSQTMKKEEVFVEPYK